MKKMTKELVDDLPRVTGEYLYYKGIIRGLEEAKGKTDEEIDLLQKVYAVNTRKIDKIIGDNNGNRF